MFSLTYISTALRHCDAGQLHKLLEKSRTNNSLHGITGMLLYKDGSFIQAIEGPEAALRQLYRNICRDPMHFNVLTLLEENIKERHFSDWSMGFADLSGTTETPDAYIPAARLQGHLDPFRQSNQDPKRLLANFWLH